MGGVLASCGVVWGRRKGGKGVTKNEGGRDEEGRNEEGGNKQRKKKEERNPTHTFPVPSPIAATAISPACLARQS